MTSATEVLRRLLDEAGIEWHDTKIGRGFIAVYEHDGITWIVTEHSSGRLSVKGCVKPTQGHYDGMTPEQAIAATLGATDARPTQAESSGTCRMVLREDIRGHAYQDTYECSECGEEVVRETCMGESEPPNFCPNCGKVVEPTTNDVGAEATNG